MEALVKQRASVKASITRIETFLNKNIDKEVDINEYVTRETALVKAFEKYSLIQDKIEELDDKQEQDRIDAENRFYTLHAALKSKLQLNNPNLVVPPTNFQQPQVQPLNVAQVKLPSLSIPSFGGKYDEWKSFIDLFTALIDSNSQLTNVQKFVYLKSALSNEPLNLINKLQLTNENYTVALNILNERYDNKLVIINNHIKNLLEVPPVNKCTANSLREFITHIKQHLNSLESLNISINEWDLLLIYSFSQKLDFNTRKAFELEKSSTQLPTLKDFFSFLEKRCVALENLAPLETKKKVSHVVNTNNADSNIRCIYCNLSNHSIYKCLKFKTLPVTQKRQFVQNNKLCFNCFGSKHSVERCTSRGCSICQRKHHTLLHYSGEQSKNSEKNSIRPSQSNETTSVNNSVNISPSSSLAENNTQVSEISSLATELVTHSNFCAHGVQQVLLATAIVEIICADGKPIYAKALLDNGSQTSFMSQELFARLNYKPYVKNMQISGIGNSFTNTNYVVNINIRSQMETKNNFNVSCVILNKITCNLPQVKINKSKIEIPENIVLADPSFFVPSKIDLLLGSDIYYDIITPGIIKLGDQLPTLQNSHLGWIIAGPVSNELTSCHMNISLFTSTCDIDEIIPRFWQLEEVSNKRFLSPQDKQCETLFINTTKRLENGSFQVDLPLQSLDSHLKLGDSYTAASKRFYSLEKRLRKDNNLYAQYKKFIDEYVTLKHGKIVPLELKNNKLENKYFMPHHCVIREDSATTKLRVVFDASMKTSTGYSLNDIMHKGYIVQPELFDILCRFRLYKFVLVADIQKMYRQIMINPSQLFLQNILWRDNYEDELQCIELQTVTYGTNSAPYLATRCLVQLANEQKENFPLAAEAILTQCYMDDILFGSNSVEELLKIREQLINILKSAGFTLHKWSSNSNKILDLSDDNLTKKSKLPEIIIKTDNVSNKVLGLAWQPQLDEFRISIPLIDDKQIPTKRSVLSKIAQMFDPLGLIGPVIVVGKLFMQKIWMQKINWDDELQLELLKEWNSFFKAISCLSEITIPRCLLSTELSSNNQILEMQIHGFADASLKSYGACIYLRVLYKNKMVSCNLVCSKSRVAPLKTVSLPRLELCGVLLLSKLVHRIMSVFSNKINNVYLWTDSQITLCWINSHPSRWNTFVANRVSEVQELTSRYQWRHVSSNENVADLLSRGLNPHEIKDNEFWWHGPQFLKDFDLNLNFQKTKINLDKIPEQRKTTFHITIENYDFTLFLKFSCFTKLQRSFAYCFRFANNVRKNSIKKYGPLTITELRNSLIFIIKVTQNNGFAHELSQLKGKHPISNTSIASLNPFIDKDGLLRVGGRLLNANIPFDQKYPILLPAKNHVVTLILRKEHLRLYHAGAQTVLTNIRLRYWPINALCEIKRIIKNCVTCHRFNARSASQLMGNLPKDRVSITRPFLKVGIDYGGPLLIKSSKLRRAAVTKCYIAIFICMVTKCVHIELVSNLSTESFLLTLKRFIARRGNPSVIYSDNATNFVGAKNQLKELREFFKIEANIDQIENFLTSNEIQWHFIPPRSPHWGGIWEAAIKSAKYHLKRIVGNATLTFEELSTILAQVEAILNSRPLCALSNDPSDLNCLTPGHFLIGDCLTSYPEYDLSNIPVNRLTIWQHLTKLRQDFWRRWSKEYLTRLQNRPKWMTPAKNLKVNDVVLLKEDNVPPLKWPRGRILEIIPGSDNRVRVVRLKTTEGVLTRPIVKLSPLPFDD